MTEGEFWTFWERHARRFPNLSAALDEGTPLQWFGDLFTDIDASQVERASLSILKATPDLRPHLHGSTLARLAELRPTTTTADRGRPHWRCSACRDELVVLVLSGGEIEGAACGACEAGKRRARALEEDAAAAFHGEFIWTRGCGVPLAPGWVDEDDRPIVEGQAYDGSPEYFTT